MIQDIQWLLYASYTIVKQKGMIVWILFSVDKTFLDVLFLSRISRYFMMLNSAFLRRFLRLCHI